MKKLLLLLLSLSLLLLIVACGGKSAENGDTTTAISSERCGDPAKLSKTLNFYNWTDYFNEELLAKFEEECGVKVNLDVYANNEDMIAKVQVGNSGYDIVVPSDYAVLLMIERGLLAELDKANLPNITNMKPEQMGLYYDLENKYSVPYQWGTTGIAYNTKYVENPEQSWSLFFDPEILCQYKGFASYLDDEREGTAGALKYLGYSLNDTDPAHHAEARELLIGMKACLSSFNSDNYIQQLVSEEVYIAHAFSGGAALARSENPDIAYFVPEEGGTIWQDNLSVVFDAPNKYTAERFINWLLDPEIGAENTNYIYYFTPNAASEPLLNEEYKKILAEGGMNLPSELLPKMEWAKRNDETIIFSDTWTQVKTK